jgi:hypothetical protein
MTVNELKFACKTFRIDLGKTTKKAEILNLIVSSGFTHDDYLEAIGEQFTHVDAPIKAKEEVVVKDETKSEQVVLKMKYPRSALNVSNKAYFTIEEPYRLFSKEKADDIVSISQGEVVFATPEEVASFYGIGK